MTVYWKITQITSGSSAREDDDVERNQRETATTWDLWDVSWALLAASYDEFEMNSSILCLLLENSSNIWNVRWPRYFLGVRSETRSVETLAEFVVKYAVVGRKKSKKQEKSPSELECLTEHGNVHFVCDSWQHRRGGEWEWIKSLDVSLTNCRMISSNPRSAQSLTWKKRHHWKALEKLKASTDGWWVDGGGDVSTQ